MRLFFLLLSALFISSLHAQQGNNQNITLTGHVADKSGARLVGATVHLKGTTHEVYTDRNGVFTFIAGQHIPAVVIVTYVGYQQQEVTINSLDPISVNLQESAGKLNDVVVRIRGATSINADNNPLYIIDGVFINNTSLQTVNTGGRATSPLADLNPADIQSVEVLKDASATAIYGSRGANGVIIITTKRGTFNSQPKLNLDASTGTNWA